MTSTLDQLRRSNAHTPSARQRYDPEEATILHDILANHLPAYAILAASRAAAQAIADKDAAEPRTLDSRAASTSVAAEQPLAATAAASTLAANPTTQSMR